LSFAVGQSCTDHSIPTPPATPPAWLHSNPLRPMTVGLQPSALSSAARGRHTQLELFRVPKSTFFFRALQHHLSPPSTTRPNDTSSLLTLIPTPRCATSTVRRPWRSLRTVRLLNCDEFVFDRSRREKGTPETLCWWEEGQDTWAVGERSEQRRITVFFPRQENDGRN